MDMDRRNDRKLKTQELSLMALFLSLVILGAYIKIPLPFMVITLQLVFTNLTALILGSRKAVIICLVYMLMGLIGLPVFATGGGPAYILDPTFGYIAGFPLGILIAGIIVVDPSRNILSALIFTTINMLITYLIGASHFHLILNVYLGQTTLIKDTLVWAVFTTLPKDLILGAITSVVAVRIKRHLPKLAHI